MSQPESQTRLDNTMLEKREKEILDTIAARISSERYSDGPQKLTIEMVINNTKICLKLPEKGCSLDEIEHIETALENPQQLQGLLSIFIDDDKVFHVEDGQVIQDDLNFVSYLQERKQIKEECALREAEGQQLAKYAKAFLKKFGISNLADRSLGFESENYIFQQINERLKVVNKSNGKEVLNNQGFTTLASELDIEKLKKFKCVAHKLIVDNSSTPPPRNKL